VIDFDQYEDPDILISVQNVIDQGFFAMKLDDKCLFESLYFGEILGERSQNSQIYKGHSRISILLSNVMCYYLFMFTIQLVTFIVLVVAITDVISMQLKTILERVTICILLGLGTASFPLTFAFIFRDAFKSIAASAIFTYLLQQLMGTAAEGSFLFRVLQFYPAFLQIDRNIWLSGLPAKLFQLLLVPSGCIAAALIISYLFFKWRELK